jgi:hypothetical protein
VRRAGYQPRESKFAAGDLVYLRRQPADGTDVSVSRGAYKVYQVGANGRMVLVGADRTLFKEHMENCAPCHNPNIDTTVDPELTTVPAGHPCQVCRSAGDEGTMLLCDNPRGVAHGVSGAGAESGTGGCLALPALRRAGAGAPRVTCRGRGDRDWQVGGNKVVKSHDEWSSMTLPPPVGPKGHHGKHRLG